MISILSKHEWKKYAVIDIEETVGIIEKARMIMNLGVKSKDALHVACSIAARCDYFLTTDIRLINKTRDLEEIAVMNPLSFISIKEE